MRRFGIRRINCVVGVLSLTAAITSSAQTLTTLTNFAYTNGAQPTAALIQSTDGSLFGITPSGGDNNAGYNWGTAFEITPSGKTTILHLFLGENDGASPQGALLQAADGKLFGTTNWGGPYPSVGDIFEIDATGKLTILYAFCSQTGCGDGLYPAAGLVQGTNGNLYGTTSRGGTGSSACEFDCGTVFEVRETGVLTTLYNFCSQTSCADGATPGNLVLAANGNFYGITASGGTQQSGTFFGMNPSGKFATLHQFRKGDGYPPNAVVQGTDGNFYGTASGGGTNGGGTVFKITSGGKLTVLYAFCAKSNCADGNDPLAGLVQGNDGNFYGTTSAGGASGVGTIFEITPAGQLTTLYSFCPKFGCLDGLLPSAALVQYTDGTFYGTTSQGGRGCCGTVFNLSTGLAAFVKSNPTFGRVGWKINILGSNLTGTTSVTFNGVSAAFTVVSSTLIEATVPSGATSGTIGVTTPSGTLSSNVAFQVR